MRDPVILLLLSSMVGNDVSAMKNTAMISALEASEIDVANFAAETSEGKDVPDSNSHVQLDSKLIGRDKNGLFKNHQSFVKLRNKINEQENAHSEMFQSINEKLQDKNFLEQAIEMSTDQKTEVAASVHGKPAADADKAGKGAVSSKAPGGMSDADVACYTGKYSDVTGDARQHYMNVGQAEGRNPNCANNITDYAAQKYIDRNPDLQYEFGRKGKFAAISARQNYTDYGFDLKKNAKSEDWDTPWFCGDTPQHQCLC